MENAGKSFFKIMSHLLTVAAMMLFVGVMIATVNALCRKFLNTSFSWAEELAQYLAVLSFYMAAPYVIMKNRMLRIDVITPLIGNKAIIKAIYIIFGLLEIVLFILLARYCIGSIISLKAGEIYLNHIMIPKYYLYVVVEISFVFAVLSLISILFLNKGEKFND